MNDITLENFDIINESESSKISKFLSKCKEIIKKIVFRFKKIIYNICDIGESIITKYSEVETVAFIKRIMKEDSRLFDVIKTKTCHISKLNPAVCNPKALIDMSKKFGRIYEILYVLADDITEKKNNRVGEKLIADVNTWVKDTFGIQKSIVDMDDLEIFNYRSEKSVVKDPKKDDDDESLIDIEYGADGMPKIKFKTSFAEKLKQRAKDIFNESDKEMTVGEAINRPEYKDVWLDAKAVGEMASNLKSLRLSEGITEDKLIKALRLPKADSINFMSSYGKGSPIKSDSIDRSKDASLRNYSNTLETFTSVFGVICQIISEFKESTFFEYYKNIIKLRNIIIHHYNNMAGTKHLSQSDGRIFSMDFSGDFKD